MAPEPLNPAPRATRAGSPQNVGARLRRYEAAQLRAKDMTFQQIADEIGVSKRTATDYVKRALAEMAEHEAELLAPMRQMQNLRIEAQISSLMRKALAGNIAAHNTIIKLHARQASLFGLDQQTTRLEVSGQVTLTVGDLVQARALGIAAATDGVLEAALERIASAIADAEDERRAAATLTPVLRALPPPQDPA